MTIEYREDDATRTAEILVTGKITVEDYIAAVEPMQAFNRPPTESSVQSKSSRAFQGVGLLGTFGRCIKSDWKNYQQNQPCGGGL